MIQKIILIIALISVSGGIIFLRRNAKTKIHLLWEDIIECVSQLTDDISSEIDSEEDLKDINIIVFKYPGEGEFQKALDTKKYLGRKLILCGVYYSSTKTFDHVKSFEYDTLDKELSEKLGKKGVIKIQ